MRRLVASIALASAALLGAAGVSVPPQEYALAPGSRFRLEGTSSVGTWACTTTDLAGGASQPAQGSVTGRVVVRVRSFDCGISRMNADFRDALRADAHPEIRLTVDQAVMTTRPSRPRAWVPARATGRLRLAGVERPVTIAATGREEADGRIRVRGRHELRMTDFGVTPPSGMGGMVRARDRVTVVFDLRAVER